MTHQCQATQHAAGGRAGILRSHVIAGIVVGAAALFAFFPVVYNDLVNWDDVTFIDPRLSAGEYAGAPAHQLRPLSDRDLAFYPVFWASLSLDRALWGTHPIGYHMKNVLLHAVSAVLVLLLARRLLGKTEGALLAATCGALIFAVHPVNVEPVAWASGRKMVLAVLFGLLAVHCYLRRECGWGWRVGVSVFFVLACLSNASIVCLPLVLVAYDVLMARRQLWPGLWRKADLLAVAAATAVARMVAVPSERDAMPVGGLGEKLLVQVRGLAQEVGSLVFPAHLANLYHVRARPASPDFWLGLLLLTGLVVGVVGWARRRPLWAFGLAWFGLSLLPEWHHHIPRADRHLYFPAIGLFLLAGWAAASLLRRSSAGRRVVVAAACLLVFVALVTLAQQQVRVWRNTHSLWSQARRVAPNLPVVLSNLGATYSYYGQYDLAIEELAKAIALAPNFVQAYETRGYAYARQGDYERAIRDLDRAIEIMPDYARAYLLRGCIYCQRQEFARGLQDYNQALRYRPRSVLARYFRGLAYLCLQQYEQAIQDLTEAIRLDPRNPDLYHRRALAYCEAGDYAKAWDDVAACRRLGGQVDAGVLERLSEVSGRRE